MANEKIDVLLIGPTKPVIFDGLPPAFNLSRFSTRKIAIRSLPNLRRGAARLRGGCVERADHGALMSRLPSSRSCRRFGVGYDHIDAQWAGAHGVSVTNTPDVLTEEVADTALGLLLCTVRESPQAER